MNLLEEPIHGTYMPFASKGVPEPTWRCTLSNRSKTCVLGWIAISHLLLVVELRVYVGIEFFGAYDSIVFTRASSTNIDSCEGDIG